MIAPACAGGGAGSPSPADTPEPSPQASASPAVGVTPTSPPDGAGGPPALVDPRDDGLEVTMGEWAVVLEADVIRPGPVTFVIRNQGARSHGFRIRQDRGGSGGDRFEVRTPLIPPGATAELNVDLAAGLYEVDCFVEDDAGEHDQLGMETVLSVREDAPLGEVRPQAPATASEVTIEGFEFAPALVEVPAGAEVVWTNLDVAPHTVTAEDGGFDSGQLSQGTVFRRLFDAPGVFAYRCDIHPAMEGSVRVTP